MSTREAWAEVIETTRHLAATRCFLDNHKHPEDESCAASRLRAAGEASALRARGYSLSALPAPDERQAGLREALAEGLHKAMCFGPTTLHNRLACERPAVYLNLADAALGHPAVREVLGVAQRSSDAAFGALGAISDDLAAQVPAQEDDKTFAAEPGASAMWRRAAAQDQLSVTERLAWAMHEARGAYGEYGAEDDCLSDAEAWMEAH